MTLIRDILKVLSQKINVPVWHYEALKQVNKYIIWAEDSQGQTQWADDRMQSQSIKGTIDYYTKTEYDSNFKEIQNALNNGDISWRLNSVQYETETKYIHYEWVWEYGESNH